MNYQDPKFETVEEAAKVGQVYWRLCLQCGCAHLTGPNDLFKLANGNGGVRLDDLELTLECWKCKHTIVRMVATPRTMTNFYSPNVPQFKAQLEAQIAAGVSREPSKMR